MCALSTSTASEWADEHFLSDEPPSNRRSYGAGECWNNSVERICGREGTPGFEFKEKTSKLVGMSIACGV